MYTNNPSGPSEKNVLSMAIVQVNNRQSSGTSLDEVSKNLPKKYELQGGAILYPLSSADCTTPLALFPKSDTIIMIDQANFTNAGEYKKVTDVFNEDYMNSLFRVKAGNHSIPAYYSLFGASNLGYDFTDMYSLADYNDSIKKPANNVGLSHLILLRLRATCGATITELNELYANSVFEIKFIDHAGTPKTLIYVQSSLGGRMILAINGFRLKISSIHHS